MCMCHYITETQHGRRHQYLTPCIKALTADRFLNARAAPRSRGMAMRIKNRQRASTAALVLPRGPFMSVNIALVAPSPFSPASSIYTYRQKA